MKKNKKNKTYGQIKQNKLREKIKSKHEQGHRCRKENTSHHQTHFTQDIALVKTNPFLCGKTLT